MNREPVGQLGQRFIYLTADTKLSLSLLDNSTSVSASRPANRTGDSSAIISTNTIGAGVGVGIGIGIGIGGGECVGESVLSLLYISLRLVSWFVSYLLLLHLYEVVADILGLMPIGTSDGLRPITASDGLLSFVAALFFTFFVAFFAFFFFAIFFAIFFFAFFLSRRG